MKIKWKGPLRLRSIYKISLTFTPLSYNSCGSLLLSEIKLHDLVKFIRLPQVININILLKISWFCTIYRIFFFSQIGCENLFQNLLCFYNYALHILTNQHNPLPPEIMFLRTKIDPPPQFDPLWCSRSECWQSQSFFTQTHI